MVLVSCSGIERFVFDFLEVTDPISPAQEVTYLPVFSGLDDSVIWSEVDNSSMRNYPLLKESTFSDSFDAIVEKLAASVKSEFE